MNTNPTPLTPELNEVHKDIHKCMCDSHALDGGWEPEQLGATVNVYVQGMEYALTRYRSFIPEHLRATADKAYANDETDRIKRVVDHLNYRATSTHSSNAGASANSSCVSEGATRSEGF